MAGVEGHPYSWRGALNRDGSWALVADGVGGHIAGEVASTLAVEILRPLMRGLKTAAEIQAAVRTADEGVFLAMQMRPELTGMGTTLVGALLRPKETLLFNVGDSRAYAIEDGKLRQVTRDQSFKSGALLQCIGGFQEPSPLYVPVMSVSPRAQILLCSDGLTDMVSDDEIVRVLRAHPENPAGVLVDLALASGGHDNVSAIVLSPPS